MDPRHDPDLILGHLEGDLSPEDTAKVQALREADPDFAALLDGMADDRGLLRAAPAAEPPAGLADAALADLERSMLLDDADDGIAMLPPGRRRRFALAPLLTYGAIAAVLALTASAVLKSVQPPAPSPPIAAAPDPNAFDIAAAPIQTQRELARRDRADVGFGADDAADADTFGARVDALATATQPADPVGKPHAGDAAEALAGPDLAQATRLEADDAPMRAKAAVPAGSVAKSSPSVEGGQEARAEQVAAFADAEAGDASADAARLAVTPVAGRIAAEAGRGGSVLGRNAGLVAANDALTLDEAAAAPASPPPGAARPAPGGPPENTAVRTQAAATEKRSVASPAPPAVSTRGVPPIAAEPAAESVSAHPAPGWMRRIDRLGGDWTRWTTLSGGGADAPTLP